MGFYPSTPKQKNNPKAKVVYASNIPQKEPSILQLTPLSQYQNEKDYHRFMDSFYNNQAGINTGNSIMQYSQFFLHRLSYQECSTLSIEPIINNAINKLSQEPFRKSYNIICENTELREFLQNRIRELEFDKTLCEALAQSLIYGGCLIYQDRGLSEKMDMPLHLTREIAQKNPIKDIRIIPPYLVGAYNVEMFNPLNKDYMRPILWNVAGQGAVHTSRLIPLVVFSVPDLILPMFNFFGLSLCQLMKEAVRNTNTAYNALADILLRFKTDIITSDLLKINPSEAIARAEFINKSKNNLGTLLLTKDEEMQQFVTSLTGLDSIVAQLQESCAICAKMPAVKLLGLTPSGFNATGDYDLNSFYDELDSMRHNILEAIILTFLRDISLEFNSSFEVDINIEWESLKDKDILKDTQSLNLLLDSCIKGIEAGIITQEQALNIIKESGYWESLDFEKENIDLTSLDLDLDNEKAL